MNLHNELVVNDILGKTPPGGPLTHIPHSSSAKQVSRGKARKKKALSSRRVSKTHEGHPHQTSRDTSKAVSSLSCPNSHPSSSSHRLEKEQIRPNGKHSSSSVHFEGNLMTSAKQFSRSMDTGKATSKHRSVAEKHSNSLRDFSKKETESSFAQSTSLQTKETIIFDGSKNSETFLSVIPCSPSSSSSSSTPCNLGTFVDEAVGTGFIVKIAGKPNLARDARPKVKSGFSMIDWHHKIQKRKATMSAEIPSRRISRAEVQEHSTPQSLWMVVSGVVYDVTDFQYFHPTIENVIRKSAGHDVTAMTEAFHPWINVHSFLSTYAVGMLATEEV